jgi:hypothetical protein
MYSKEFGNGTLYALVLSKKTAHATLDRRIVDLDRILMRAGGDSSTRFTSVSAVMDGKVKTFGVGEHVADEHFRAIFSSGTPGGGRDLLVHSGVMRWDPPPPLLIGGSEVDGGGPRGSGNIAVGGSGDELGTQMLLDKTVQKLRSRVSVYKKVLSVSGRNIAGLKLTTERLRDALDLKVCFVLALMLKSSSWVISS